MNQGFREKWLRSTPILLVGTLIAGQVLGVSLAGFSLGISPALAQRVDVQDAWKQVYQVLPDLPLENRYVNRETGKVDPNNTLIGRFIRYHIYVKGRPAAYRLDWKLSLADYLGVNEIMQDQDYPSAKALRQNPIDSDREAIKKLTLAQRSALVDTLVGIFNPASRRPQLRSTPAPGPSPTVPQTAPKPRSQGSSSSSSPGGARLLQP